jgi:cytidylate kinase
MTGVAVRVVAVDGPAASGKTTLARRLAAHFHLPFLDTGLLYRAVALKLLRAGRSLDDRAAALAGARSIAAADLEDPSLRDDEVAHGASRVAVVPEVREALLVLQRRFGEGGPGAVLAGRDIGTVVRPDATHKVFVTASAEERARRRCKELRASGAAAIYERVLEDLRQRDTRDRSRVVAPLVPASDAFVIDTTDRDAETAFAIACDFVAGPPRTAPAEEPPE